MKRLTIHDDFAATRKLYLEIDKVLAWPEHLLLAQAPEVSEWSAAQQLQHVAQVNRGIMINLERVSRTTEDKDQERTVTTIGRSVLASGFMPRGVGKSPTLFLPADDLTIERLVDEIGANKAMLSRIAPRLGDLADRQSKSRHPYFGYFNPRQWVRLMHVHTLHHLKIVRDIEKAIATPP